MNSCAADAGAGSGWASRIEGWRVKLLISAGAAAVLALSCVMQLLIPAMLVYLLDVAVRASAAAGYL